MVGIFPLWLNCLFRIQETKQDTQIEQMNDLATGKPSGVLVESKFAWVLYRYTSRVSRELQPHRTGRVLIRGR